MDQPFKATEVQLSMAIEVEVDFVIVGFNFEACNYFTACNLSAFLQHKPLSANKFAQDS